MRNMAALAQRRSRSLRACLGWLQDAVPESSEAKARLRARVTLRGVNLT